MGVINRGNRKKYVTSCAIWPENFIEKMEREGSDKTREQGKIKKNMCCMAKEGLERKEREGVDKTKE